VEVSTAKKSPELFSTYMNDPLALAEGGAEDGGLTLKFFRTSGDSSPAATVVFDNQWAIFNLYLRQDTVSGSDGKTYIPIYLSDNAGRYVYFVDVSFSADIPASSAWYSLYNWPQFAVTDTAVSSL
jgi:hypothetical protein